MIWRKTLDGMSPADEESQEWFSKTKSGALVEMKCLRKRNLNHHRKFFQLLKVVTEHTEDFSTIEQVRFALMAIMQRGTWVEVKRATNPLFIPDSISFSNMSQHDFEVFYDDAINCMIKYIVPMDKKDLIRELISA